MLNAVTKRDMTEITMSVHECVLGGSGMCLFHHKEWADNRSWKSVHSLSWQSYLICEWGTHIVTQNIHLFCPTSSFLSFKRSLFVFVWTSKICLTAEKFSYVCFITILFLLFTRHALELHIFTPLLNKVGRSSWQT